jgi:hypothetical protein
MAYLGKTPSQGTRNRFYFTASGGETSLSGADDNGNTLTFADGAFVDVSVNGISLVAGTDYNTSTDNTIAGLTALSASDVVEIVAYDVFNIFSGSVNGPLNVSETVTASAFSGDGSALTNLPAAGISAVVDDTTPQLGGNLDTNGNNITFGDSTKAIFGASSDLQIYHSGANSFVSDQGTGNLYLATDGTSVNITRGNGVENMGVFTANGAVTLYHNNIAKIATTTTGVDVTGDVSISGGAYLGGTASANYLDDYEEGTWTPTDASGAGLTFSVTTASYVRIGKTCTVQGHLTFPATSSTATVLIGGLPFTIVGFGTFALNSNVNGGHVIQLQSGAATYKIRNQTSGAFTNAQFSSAFTIFSGTYIIA